MYIFTKHEEKHKLFSYLLIIGNFITLLVAITISAVYLYYGQIRSKIIFTAIFPFFMFPFSYIVYKISKKGNTDKALKIYMVITSVLLMVSVYIFRGAFSASNNFFVWIVLLSGMLIKPVYALYSSIFFGFYIGLLFLLQYSGIYVPLTSNPDRITLVLNTSYNVIVMIFAVGYLTYLNMKHLSNAQKKLKYNATHDYLTNLLNRNGLKESLTEILERTDNKKLALLFVDLDNFKEINDRIGHEAGDRLITEIADRLKENASDKYGIARFGGDEFVLFIEFESSYEELKKTINGEILKLVSMPYKVDGHEFEITASIGVSIYPDNSSTRKELITHADIAMHRAKKEGKNRIVYYNEDLKRIITGKIDIKNKLRKAIPKEELVLYYQPQTLIKNDEIVGLEALIRWKHEDKIIPPDEFIPIAEESGMILEIGEWIFKKACVDLKKWHDKGKKISLSVNFSSIQFRQNDIVEKIKRIITETGVKPDYIEIEITETGLMEQDETIIKKISQIKEIGIKISIDDFGTGYSSLAYLKQFNVDKVKIDKSFIYKLNENSEDKPIVKAIIAMSTTLNLEVIAEGVETEYQKKFLQENNCKLYQGYYCSRPLPPEEIEKLIIKK